MIGDPFTTWPIWQSADLRPTDDAAPLYIDEWATLREQCRRALDRRRETYPAWIAAGKITEDLAARDIRAWEQLLGQWIWIVDGPEAPGAVLPARQDLIDRVEAVDLALARVSQEINRGNRTFDVLLQSHLNQALRWHLEPERFSPEAPAVAAARLTRSLRAERGTQARLAA
jgi:hypothetical protein